MQHSNTAIHAPEEYSNICPTATNSCMPNIHSKHACYTTIYVRQLYKKRSNKAIHATHQCLQHMQHRSKAMHETQQQSNTVIYATEQQSTTWNSAIYAPQERSNTCPTATNQ